MLYNNLIKIKVEISQELSDKVLNIGEGVEIKDGETGKTAKLIVDVGDKEVDYMIELQKNLYLDLYSPAYHLFPVEVVDVANEEYNHLIGKKVIIKDFSNPMMGAGRYIDFESADGKITRILNWYQYMPQTSIIQEAMNDNILDCETYKTLVYQKTSDTLAKALQERGKQIGNKGVANPGVSAKLSNNSPLIQPLNKIKLA